MSIQQPDENAKGPDMQEPAANQDSQDSDLGNFLKGAGWYLLGGLAGIGFLILAYFLGIGRWLVDLIPAEQTLIRLLAIPLTVGLLLALGGGILGGFGGWSLGKIMRTKKDARLTVGSGIAFGVTTGLLILVFLLVVSFFALYNNLTTNRFEHFGLLFGLFGLVFGLVLGLVQAFLTLRLRYTWRAILAAIIGFGLGGLLMGILVRLVITANLFKTSTILAWLILILALVIPIAIGGGAFGFTYGRLSRRVVLSGMTADSLLASRWQLTITAIVVILVAFTILGFLGNISNFLTINPGFLQSQIAPVTVSVGWSSPQFIPPEGLPVMPSPTIKDQAIETATGLNETLHKTWCSQEGTVQYQQNDSKVEEIKFPSCSRAPVIAMGGDGYPHMVWYTQEIRDTNDIERSTSVLVESIRKPDGWSEAAIVAQTEGEVIPSMAGDAQGNLYLVWNKPSGDPSSAYYAVQGKYECSETELSTLERAGLDALLGGDTRPAGTQIPYCGNLFQRIVYTPNPKPEYSEDPITQNGGFDIVSLSADQAQYEVLFTTMQWEENTSPPNPGSVLTTAVAYLYNDVKTNPGKYPRGMTVRILLGNYPVMADFTWGSQIYEVITQMREAGVEQMVDPEIGWRLEVANYSGTYPHSHTKFVVIDGKSVLGVGFNYGYLHFPKDHPSGKGYDLFDLGLSITGPIAQESIAVYDDLWSGANQIYCEDFQPEDGSDWTDTCQEIKAVSDHVPEVLRTYLPDEGKTNSFSLYRTKEFKEGDEFIAASLAAASQTIDAMEVNFSLELVCMANLVVPDLCTIENALPWMDAMLEAVERDHVKVRVIMENTNSNGLENRVAGEVLLDELERRGLSEFVELRFYNGKIHAKSILIDNSLLIIGSQNLHYSAWGENGLAEYSLTTDDANAIAEYHSAFEAKWQEAIPFAEANYGSSP